MRDFSIDLIWVKLQIAIAGIGGWLGYALGGKDGLLIALVVFMSIDYITGIMCAIHDRKLSSAVGFRGICKKVLIMALVGIAHTLDVHVIGGGATLRTATIFYVLSNEGLSILENATRFGLPVPDKLREVLVQLHDKDGKQSVRMMTKRNEKHESLRYGRGQPLPSSLEDEALSHLERHETTLRKPENYLLSALWRPRNQSL